MAKGKKRSVFDMPAQEKRTKEGAEIMDGASAGSKPPVEDADAGSERTEQKRQIIGKEEVRQANETLRKYKEGKKNLENRIVENEKWWKMQHWDLVRNPNKKGKIEPRSAWLFNSIANKHADAMDNYPEPSVLPRDEHDEITASQLSAVLPVVLDINNYEQIYSDTWWYKLKQGTGIKGIFWNGKKNNGIGDVDIRKMDALMLFWQPGVTDIQSSRNLFSLELIDNAVLKEQYPDKDLHLSTYPGLDVTEYIYDDNVDTTEKSIVVDWYYKKEIDGRTVLHYCKYVGETVLYASENEPEYKDSGFYDHGKYPFIFDTLFPVEGSPFGYGYIDVMKDAQMYIDKMQQAMLENTLVSSKKRYFVKQNAGINKEQFMDLSQDIVDVAGTDLSNNIMEITSSSLGGIYVNMLNMKIDELKETSGNRDFSQGSPASGVTAASAIAALQEAGSKLSRDTIKSAYRSFQAECYLIIELIRQFYDIPRNFRIDTKAMDAITQAQQLYGGEAGMMGMAADPMAAAVPQYGSSDITTERTGHAFTTFDNTGLKPEHQGQEFDIDLGYRVPQFDVNVVAAKKSSFSRTTQNELAIQFFGLGFFNPQMTDQALACLDMMEFEGKEGIMDKISRNGTLYTQLQQMQEQMLQMQLQMQAMQDQALKMGVALDTLVPGAGVTQDVAANGEQIEGNTQALVGNQLGMAQGIPNRSAAEGTVRRTRGETLSNKAAVTARNATSVR